MRSAQLCCSPSEFAHGVPLAQPQAVKGELCSPPPHCCVHVCALPPPVGLAFLPPSSSSLPPSLPPSLCTRCLELVCVPHVLCRKGSLTRWSDTSRLACVFHGLTGSLLTRTWLPGLDRCRCWNCCNVILAISTTWQGRAVAVLPPGVILRKVRVLMLVFVDYACRWHLPPSSVHCTPLLVMIQNYLHSLN